MVMISFSLYPGILLTGWIFVWWILWCFIKRANQFSTMYGRGKGHAEYQGVAKQNSLKAHVTKVNATTWFASSSFSQFESVYESYEALCKAFSAIRETDDEDEEMKYMVKGRDFC